MRQPLKREEAVALRQPLMIEEAVALRQPLLIAHSITIGVVRVPPIPIGVVLVDETNPGLPALGVVCAVVVLPYGSIHELDKLLLPGVRVGPKHPFLLPGAVVVIEFEIIVRRWIIEKVKKLQKLQARSAQI